MAGAGAADQAGVPELGGDRRALGVDRAVRRCRSGTSSSVKTIVCGLTRRP